MTQTVAVILVNWNGCKDTIECLESLLRLEDSSFKIFVVDNGSVDGSIDAITAFATEKPPLKPTGPPWSRLAETRCHLPTISLAKPQDKPRDSLITIIDAAENLGFAGANNIGMAFASRDPDVGFFWLLNNDTVVAGDSLLRLRNAAEHRPDAAILGSCLYYYHDPAKVQAVAGFFKLNVVRGGHLGHGATTDTLESAHAYEARMAYVVGASMFVSRACYEEVGGMSEDYFLYFEELDWAYRIGRNRQALALDSVVYHKEGASIGSSSTSSRPSDTSLYYLNTNLLRFIYRWHKPLLPLAVLRVFRESLHYWNHPKTLKTIAIAVTDRLFGVNRKGKINF